MNKALLITLCVGAATIAAIRYRKPIVAKLNEIADAITLNEILENYDDDKGSTIYDVR